MEPTVDLAPTPDGVRITVVGDLDMRVAHLPQQLLAEYLEAGGRADRVVIDLAAVDFVDSTGLGGLVRIKHETAAPDAAVELEHANERVRQLLSMTGLESDFVVTG